MPRGAEYDDGIPHSDNAIEAGETKIHGTNPDVRYVLCTPRVRPPLIPCRMPVSTA